MATINDGELHLDIDGADEEALRRGLAAARRSLADSGVALWDAFRGQFEIEQADDLDMIEQVDPVDASNARALSDATAAARAAAFPGDVPRSRASLGMQGAIEESERRIDELGIRHLNPDRGPHHYINPDALRRHSESGPT